MSQHTPFPLMNHRPRIASPILAFLLCVGSSAAAQSGKDLIVDFCLGCHDSEREKGDFNLEVPLYDHPIAKNPSLWGEVIKRLSSGEMPPEEAAQLTDKERSVLIAWLKQETAPPAAKSKPDFSDIPIIDTHIHLYDTRRPGGVPWPPESDKVLYRPILTGQFNAVADKNGVGMTVIVEASDLVEDNQWVLDLVKDQPRRYLSVVGNLPIGTPGFARQLKRFSKDDRYVGIRMRQRPGGENFFTDDVWRDLRLMAKSGMTLDVLLANFSLADIDLIAGKIPDLKILINHVTGLNIKRGPADPKWVTAVQRAARHPNVYCKVSGLFQRSGQSPAPKDLAFYRPTLDVICEAFGEDRLIYGSNWPVTLRGGTYAEYKAIIMEYFAPKGRSALEKLLHMNARAFYGLK